MKQAKVVQNDCHQCKNMRPVAGDAHIRCIDPDPKMTGHPHGVQNGWFFYPMLFDPTWMTKACANYQRRGK